MDNIGTLRSNFNPRSLAGATGVNNSVAVDNNISIHAPLRERPEPLVKNKVIAAISIHAPLRERRKIQDRKRHHQHFNPRSLAGATKSSLPITLPATDFNPRSLAGATVAHHPTYRPAAISIHAPLRERRLKYLFK